MNSHPQTSTCFQFRPPPVFINLAQDPQLASIAVLQTALPVTQAALRAHHDDWQTSGAGHTQGACDWVVRLLARIIHARCSDLSDLLAEYRTALAGCSDSQDDDPF